MLGYTQGDVRGSDGMFRGDLVADVAAKHEPGLQLLLLNTRGANLTTALPITLRYLFLKFR